MNERDIFHAAVEIFDPGERSAYLAKVCAANASLKRQVEGMLEVYPELGAFLESPAVDLDSAATLPVAAAEAMRRILIDRGSGSGGRPRRRPERPREVRRRRFAVGEPGRGCGAAVRP
jgi:hypothetical protein